MLGFKHGILEMKGSCRFRYAIGLDDLDRSKLCFGHVATFLISRTYGVTAFVPGFHFFARYLLVCAQKEEEISRMRFG